MNQTKRIVLSVILVIVAFLIQQISSVIIAVLSLVPEHAQRVEMRQGKVILDGVRELSIWELPMGTGLFWGSILGVVLLAVGSYLIERRNLGALGLRAFSIRSWLPWVGAFLLYSILVLWLESTYEVFRSAAMETAIQSSSNRTLMLTLLGMGVVGPVFEELVFRGVLFTKIQDVWGRNAAWITTSILFTLLHMQYNVPILMVLFLLALLLGAMRRSTGSVFPSIIVHVLNNLAAAWMTLA